MATAQPQPISLSEAEVEKAEITEADIKNICDHTTKTKSLLQDAFHRASADLQSGLEPIIEDLQHLLAQYELIFALRKELKKQKQTLTRWIPRGHITDIIQACCNHRYEEHDLETILYEHGDINGLLVFHLGTKVQTKLHSKAHALPTASMADLAKRCKKEELNTHVPDWIDNYDRSKVFDPTKPLRRLHRWTEEKVKEKQPPQHRKRARSGTQSTPTQGVGPEDSIPQTGTQINSSNTGTLQHLPPDRLPLRFTCSNTPLHSRELPPPAPVRQQHSAALSNVVSNFGASSSVVNMSSMQPISDEQFIDEFLLWGWTSDLPSFNPNE